jgi:hypothetical protein
MRTAKEMELREKITALEQKEAEQTATLKLTFDQLADQLTPAELLQNALESNGKSPSLLQSFLGSSAGILAGFFARKFFTGASSNPVRRIAGNGIELLISEVVRKKLPQWASLLTSRKKEAASA